MQIPFEEKRFCQIHTLSERWDMPIKRIRDLARKGVLRFWHPEGERIAKGRLIEVASILEAEKNGYLDPNEL